MEKIDMKDKYFHAVQWDCEYHSYRLQVFKKILEGGYILSPASQYKSDEFIDDIFLSVYPKGNLCYLYPGDKNKDFKYDGFKMTSNSFFFILDSKLRNDQTITPGIFPNECTVKDSIDLYKYLVGIGNVGYDIDYRLLYVYYLTLVINGEMTKEEFLDIVNTRALYFDTQSILEVIEKGFKKSYKSGIKSVYSSYDWKESVTSIPPDKLIMDRKWYESIVKVLKDMNKTIKLFDLYGDEVTAVNQDMKVLKMQEYIKKNGYSYRTYHDSVVSLQDMVKKQN